MKTKDWPSLLDLDFKIVCYEEYYGQKDEVIRMLDHCSKCGSKLVFSHIPDYRGFFIQEMARCLDCGKGNRKVLHLIN